jgi:hypothetical protein
MLLNADIIVAIMMVNAGKPIERIHHIDIQLVALLTWIKVGDMMLAHIKGINNPSDALTKALGWVFHHHHCLCKIELDGPPYSNTTGHIG